MQVKLLATLRNITDRNEVEIEAEDVEDVINKLIKKYGSEMEKVLLESGTLKETISILVNGRNIIYLEGVETKLNENDKVTIFPQVAGG